VYFAGESDRNRDAADRWRARAQTLQDRLTRRGGTLNERTRALNRTAAQLDASEADVRRLERRQLALADEKAQAEDQTGAIARVAAEQQACSDGMRQLLGYVAEEDYEWVVANIDAIDAACDAAAADFAALQGGE